jgi:alanyl-tRNA synthetase
MKEANNIRNSFLNFFQKNDHERVTSSSLIPQNDPTLMFVTAGMVQFKNIFTGVEKPSYLKAASSQKCVRAGGKHNDLDNVGYTARHHTFFEMLGNFSFGDYFKEGAIELAWQFLTKELGLPQDRLYITVYQTDDEAFNIWQKITSFPDSKIIRINSSDNFWSMGDTGPCGPCSEIFYDHGDKVFGGLPGTKDADGDRYTEIWNLVFMQYEQIDKDTRVALPKPCIDTGMGLERLTAVVQNVYDNYDIDLFRHLILASEEISGTKSCGEHGASHRVLADHLRSSSFLIADGIMPSNEGRGYVLRRIMRRAMRHAHQLGCKEPLMHRLFPYLLAQMGAAYPELERAKTLITDILFQEEERFKLTLSKGLKLLEQEVEHLNNDKELPGEIAFKLYDTYGFPLDLTKDILRKQDILVNEQGFEEAMKKQRELAKAAWVGSGEKSIDNVWFDIYNKFGATDFLGYELEHAQGKTLALVEDGKLVTEFSTPGGEIAIICNQTPFYGESGGQVGDRGTLTGENGLELLVYDTKKYFNHLHVHFAKLVSGTIKQDDILDLRIDKVYRNKLRANHSATHILHAVLARRLGEQVVQKGSLVNEDKLRFDISFNRAIKKEELQLIEQDVNYYIRQNSEVRTVLMSLEDARQKNIMALFGEKYENEVRVVSMGRHFELDFSAELCGGTHVHRTGDIGVFKITAESAIAAGVRRIEAITGEEAFKYLQNNTQTLNEVAALVYATSNDVQTRVETLLQDKKKIENQLSEAKKQLILAAPFDSEQLGGVNFVHKIIQGADPKEIREVVEILRKQKTASVIAIIASSEQKVAIVVAITDDIKNEFHAVELASEAVAILGGSKAGGKQELAQGGGSEIGKAKQALEAIKAKLPSA